MALMKGLELAVRPEAQSLARADPDLSSPVFMNNPDVVRRQSVSSLVDPRFAVTDGRQPTADGRDPNRTLPVHFHRKDRIARQAFFPAVTLAPLLREMGESAVVEPGPDSALPVL